MDAPVEELAWEEDVLPGYRCTRVAGTTLVRPVDSSEPEQPRAVVLHVHGRNDYFFHQHLAAEFLRRGLAFVAVDMRRAGRSLQPGDHPHHVDSIDELADDIDAAVRATARLCPGTPVIIHAHSTGGLAATVWAARHPDAPVAGIILNSPHYGLRLTRWERLKMKGVPWVARITPTRHVAQASPTYARHQHRDHGGRWEFDPRWKHIDGDPVTAGWLAAVARAHRQLARGVEMPFPMLIARADSTGPDREDNPRLDEQDTVIDVEAIARMRAHLRGQIDDVVIDGAVHDLSLSATEPRQRYVDVVTAWIDTVLS